MATAVASGSPIGVSASLSGKIFSNIKYLNISYPDELLEAFETWDPNFITLGFQPDIPPSIRDRIVDQPVPYMFSKYEVESSFIINYWQVVSVLVIVAFFLLCFRVFEHITLKIKKKYLPHSFFKGLRVTGQNFLFTQLYSVFGDLIFYTILEWRTLDPKTYLSWLSIIVSIILYGIMIGCFCFHLNLIFNYQKIKKKSTISGNPDVLNKYADSFEGSQVLFRDFKDSTFTQQGFLFFFTLRDIALSLIFTTLFLHPFTQAFLLFAQNLAMILYLIIKKPFESKMDLLQQLVFEALVFVVNTSVFIMACLDKLGYEAIYVRNRLGKGIIVICMMFSFITLGFVVLKLLISLKYGYDAWKAKRNQKKIQKTTSRLKNLSQNILLDPPVNPFENATNISQLSAGEDSIRQFINSNNNLTRLNKNKKYVGTRFLSPGFDFSTQNSQAMRNNHNNHNQFQTTAQDSLFDLSYQSLPKMGNNRYQLNNSTQDSLLENSLFQIYNNFDEKIKEISAASKPGILPSRINNPNNAPIPMRHLIVPKDNSNKKGLRFSPSQPSTPQIEDVSLNSIRSNKGINVDPQISILSLSPPIQGPSFRFEEVNQMTNNPQEKKKVPFQRTRTNRPRPLGGVIRLDVTNINQSNHMNY